MRFFEDWTIGDREELGTAEFSAEDIIRFASAYDRQYFHLDAEKAKSSLFGALCASGWHTCSMFMRQFVAWSDRVRAEAEARGEAATGIGPSPGLEDISWPKPVYAGDAVTYYLTVEHKRALRSRPGWGLLHLRAEGFNQHGEKVMSLIDKAFVQCRGKGDGQQHA